MESKKRFYSKEFKEKAVSLSYQRDNIKELANELGINVQRLYKWRTSMISINPTGSFSGVDENKRLKKELKNAQLELEILKKAVHIFSRSDGKFISL